MVVFRYATRASAASAKACLMDGSARDDGSSGGATDLLMVLTS